MPELARIQDVPDSQPKDGPDLVLDAYLPVIIPAEKYSAASSELAWMHTSALGLWILVQRWVSLVQSLHRSGPPLFEEMIEERGPPLMSWQFSPEIALIQQWFSVSAVHLFDAAWAVMAKCGATDDIDRKAYQSAVLGPILSFRNKVGAHLASHRTNKRDSHDDRILAAASGMCLQVRGDVIIPTTRIYFDDESPGKQSELAPWSVGQAYQILFMRFLASPPQLKHWQETKRVGAFPPPRFGQYGLAIELKSDGGVSIDLGSSAEAEPAEVLRYGTVLQGRESDADRVEEWMGGGPG